jgi:hypothetical protein
MSEWGTQRLLKVREPSIVDQDIESCKPRQSAFDDTVSGKVFRYVLCQALSVDPLAAKMIHRSVEVRCVTRSSHDDQTRTF